MKLAVVSKTSSNIIIYIEIENNTLEIVIIYRWLSINLLVMSHINILWYFCRLKDLTTQHILNMTHRSPVLYLRYITPSLSRRSHFGNCCTRTIEPELQFCCFLQECTRSRYLLVVFAVVQYLLLYLYHKITFIQKNNVVLE